MRKRKWLVAFATFMVIGGLVLPQCAACIHFVLLRENSFLTFHPITGWKWVLRDTRVLHLYLLLAALVATALICCAAVGGSIKYRSDMQQITPDIYTPVPEGQGQYGTAKWMPRSAIKNHFAIWQRPSGGWFSQLMGKGKEQYQEVKEAHVSLD